MFLLKRESVLRVHAIAAVVSTVALLIFPVHFHVIFHLFIFVFFCFTPYLLHTGWFSLIIVSLFDFWRFSCVHC